MYDNAGKPDDKVTLCLPLILQIVIYCMNHIKKRFIYSQKPNLILNVDGCIAVCLVDLLRHCGSFTRYSIIASDLQAVPVIASDLQPVPKKDAFSNSN